ncbi:MAG: hypothetical protein MZV64_17505 [Ignavibacteriales bacterium]|nr:hypothetical protein [Ignavibacteriales bacterium]
MDAVRIAAETKPDLILMDIKMQGPMDAIETAAQIPGRSRIFRSFT